MGPLALATTTSALASSITPAPHSADALWFACTALLAGACAFGLAAALVVFHRHQTVRYRTVRYRPTRHSISAGHAARDRRNGATGARFAAPRYRRGIEPH